MSFVKTTAFAVFAALSMNTPALATTIDFDDLTPGAAVTEIDGVSFASNTGLDLIVSTGLETTSGANYLGVDDGGTESFLSGDEVALTFAAPIVSLSITAITTPAFPLGALTLSGGGEMVVSAAAAGMLPSGDEIFILSILSDTPFVSATLSSVFGGVFAFNIDDIIFEAADAAVPIPGAGVLFLTVLGAGAMRRRRAV